MGLPCFKTMKGRLDMKMIIQIMKARLGVKKYGMLKDAHRHLLVHAGGLNSGGDSEISAL